MEESFVGGIPWGRIGSSSSIFDPDQALIEQTRRFGYRNRLIIHKLPLILSQQ